jgi:hypothetical protein
MTEIESPSSLVLPNGALSRRSLFLGTGALAFIGATTLITAEPAFAAAPQTPHAVIVAAKKFEGKTRAQMNKIWSSKYDTQGEWCAIFASYALRGTDTKFNASASGLFKSLKETKNPRQGDLIWYYNAGHIGLVTYVKGSTIHTLEGNAGTAGAAKNKVKLYNKPWSTAVRYCRPKY